MTPSARTLRSLLPLGALAVVACGGPDGSDPSDGGPTPTDDSGTLGVDSGDPVDSTTTDSGTDTDTDTGIVSGASVSVDEHGVVTCADPGKRSGDLPFQRRTSPTPPNSDLWIWAGGEISADFDGDGYLDVMTPNEYGMELYQGTPTGDFEAVGMQVMSSFDLSYGTGGSVADYDGDGDIDVYVARFQGDPGPEGGTLGKNRLLQNNGDGTFTDVTDEAGVDGCGLDANTGETGCFRTMSSSWGDVDLDGDLDLFVGNYGWVDESGVSQDEFEPAEPSFLYLNDGDGTFTDVSDRLPQKFRDGYTYSGGFLDLDDDGDLDLYTVNDFGNKWPNHVLYNNGDGTFTDDELTNSSGLILNTTGMGLGIADFNGDGMMDLAMPYWNGNLLMLSQELLGGWIDFSASTGFTVVAPQKVGWGTYAGDIDNDRDVDLIQQYGHVANENPTWSNPLSQPDAMYLNEGTVDDPSFVDVGLDWEVADPGVNRGALLADFNRDGWLDIAKRNLAGPNVVYLSHCGDDGFLTLHLRMPGTMNTHAVGAKVEVVAGGDTMTRWLLSGGLGYGVGEPPELHFGLGDATIIDEIRITWPDGEVSVVTDVAGSQQVTISRE